MRNIYLPIFVILTCLVFSCKNNKKNIISTNEMTAILTELHLAESLAQHLPKDSFHTAIKNEDSLKKYTTEIFKRNQVTESQFHASVEFYKSKPEILDSIYNQILSNLTILNSQ